MKNITILLIVLALMALTGCTGNFVKDEEVIKIGFSGALTGPNAALGVNNQRGVQMAVDKLNSEDGINGLPVEIVYLDDQFEGKQTIINFQKFVDIDKVDVVLTTTYGGSMSVAEFADQIALLLLATERQQITDPELKRLLMIIKSRKKKINIKRI